MKTFDTKTDIAKIIEGIIRKGERDVMYGIADKPIVLTCYEGQVDREIAERMGYMVVVNTSQHGGTLVLNEGDFELLYYDYSNIDFLNPFIENLLAWLKSKGLNAEYTGNDVLVDGYKVASTMAKPHGSMLYSAVHIGSNAKIEDIKAMCTKPMVKVPKGLSDYGIGWQEVEQWFLQFYDKWEVERK